MKYSANHLNLRSIPVFHDLPAHLLHHLYGIASVQTLEAKDILFYQDERAKQLYIVGSGCLRLVAHTPNGQDVTLQFLGEGDLVGLQALIEKGMYPGCVQALESSMVICLEGRGFQELLHLHPSLSVAVIHLLIHRVQNANTRIRELITERVEQRLGRTLLAYSEKFGKPVDDGVEIHLRQQDLAEFAGTTIETVNRTIRQWEKDGYLQCGRKQIIIKNASGLSPFSLTA